MRICWQPMSRYSFWNKSAWNCLIENVQLKVIGYNLLGVGCRFQVEEKAKLIRFCIIFFKMAIQLRSTCKDLEAKRLTMWSCWITTFKNKVCLQRLALGLYRCIQSDRKSTCPWSNIRNTGHCICLESFISEFNGTKFSSWWFWHSPVFLSPRFFP